MTLSELRQRVWDRVGEDNILKLRYTSALVDEFLNDAVRTFARIAELNTDTTTITRQDSTLIYDLPNTCLTVLSVRNDTATHRRVLEPATFHGFDGRPGKANLNSLDSNSRILAPLWETKYSDRATHFLLYGLEQIILWPMIATAADTYTVTYLADLARTSMTADADEPGIPEEFHHHLADYAVARCQIINAAGGRGAQAAKDVQAFFSAALAAKSDNDNSAIEFSPSMGVT